MTEKEILSTPLSGLAEEEVIVLRNTYGKNIFKKEAQNRFLQITWEIVSEPMFLLLAIACTFYFVLGQAEEGILMLVAIMFVTAISFYQEIKSSNALEHLKQFSQQQVKVMRAGIEKIINAEEIVPGDIILLTEGMHIPADAVVLQQNDLSVNESVITGESFPAAKKETEPDNILYQGTTINSGKCIALVNATGNNTTLGKLGKSIESYQSPKTLLQVQINRFVKRFAFFGLFIFFLIFLVNYLHYHEWIASLLFALTLAMSIAPEEIPVAFSSFMALGAYKMSKLGIISRQPQVIENLGAVSVVCFDKTGTITENRMQVKTIYDHSTKSCTEFTEQNNETVKRILLYAALASERDPFDAMEKAICNAYLQTDATNSIAQLPMLHEYPLQGNPPMMTHVYAQHNAYTIAAKGAAERIMQVCKLNSEELASIQAHTAALASKGYRVLGVASATSSNNNFPREQDDFNWQFEGLVSLYDPPRTTITATIQQLYNAGIQVKIITGDHPGTAVNIAEQVGIRHSNNTITGASVMQMQTGELASLVSNTNIFARMFPEAKLKVIDALKANGEIVAMTGDGVNDGPALKSSSIGIAMGKKGTEIARQAADLILTDDNPGKIVLAITEGRKIFNNLKKAIRYIISIHIPIILTASLPLLLGWKYPNIFTPIHIIFLELIMGPTCSVFFEREPAEHNSMQQAPRKRNTSLFNTRELLLSIVQGVVIAIAVLGLYYYYMNRNATIEEIRTIVFITLIAANVFLTFVNRSFRESILHTARYKNNLAAFIVIISAGFLAALWYLPFVQQLFRLQPISLMQLLTGCTAALLAVLWFEVYKIFIRLKR